MATNQQIYDSIILEIEENMCKNDMYLQYYFLVYLVKEY